MSGGPAVEQRQLAVEWLAADDLTPYHNQARTHSRKQLALIAKSIRHHGFVNPILIDDGNMILCGHARWHAARDLGMRNVPTIRLSRMSEADKRAYILADNALATKAGWDQDMLKSELGFLLSLDIPIDMELSGFELPEIDGILIGEVPADAETTAAGPDPDAPVISQRGDLWHIGEHRVLCGDAREAGHYARILGEEEAELILTDPPYNVRIAGNVSGLGSKTHREFAMGSGEMTKAEFVAFLRTVMQRLVECSAPGSIHMLFMDWRHMEEMLEASGGVYTEIKNLVVWNKTNAGMGTFYRSQHELIFVFKAGTAAHINNFGLGEHGRHRTNVWTYAGVNSFGKGRKEELAIHPTCKPVALLMDAILDCSNRGGIVVDAFGGSGSTLVAAHRAGRRAALIEIDPAYVDVIVRRAERETGLTARLTTGESFAEVAVLRGVVQEAA